MKLQQPRHPLWWVRTARKQRRLQPRRSRVKRWTPPASTPAPWRSIWSLRCSTLSSAKGEALFLLDPLSLSLQCVCFYGKVLTLWEKLIVRYNFFILLCSCGEVVTKREQFNDLSIDLPRRKKTLPLRSIQDSLDLFFRVSLFIEQIL